MSLYHIVSGRRNDNEVGKVWSCLELHWQVGPGWSHIKFNLLHYCYRYLDFAGQNATKHLRRSEILVRWNGPNHSGKLQERSWLLILHLSLKSDAMFQWNTTENYGTGQVANLHQLQKNHVLKHVLVKCYKWKGQWTKWTCSPASEMRVWIRQYAPNSLIADWQKWTSMVTTPCST